MRRYQFILLLAVGAISVISRAAAQQNSPANDKIEIECDAFERKANGMWRAMRPTTITVDGKSIGFSNSDIPPGMTVTGTSVVIASLLDRMCRGKRS